MECNSQTMLLNVDRSNTQFISFLQDELAIPAQAIAVALKHREQDAGLLHMILWQYGLVSLEQLQRIFDWLEYSTQFKVCCSLLDI
ncbi:MAG: hypothetical protein Fur006_52800 [Coleofasciculaceae cyanobacterium]